MTHTVEKFGGTTMAWSGVYDRLMLGERAGAARYGRMFVVSAYAGVTDLLLENKRSGEPGAYSYYRAGSSRWTGALARAANHMFGINHELFERATDRSAADEFISRRVAAIQTHLTELQRQSRDGSAGADHLSTAREELAGLGEAHSAYNTASLLRTRGVHTTLVDLTDIREPDLPPLDALLRSHCACFDLTRTLPVVTGHAHCSERLVATHSRGYTEITFSHLAGITRAREAVIHKEYHLSSADPRIIDERSIPVGRTNYDVADQLSLLGMEAIHPGAARVLRRAGIPLRMKCAFDPDHDGTLIDGNYRAKAARVEIITGRRDIRALVLFDHELLDRSDHQMTLANLLDAHDVAIIARESNANSAVHYVACDAPRAHRLRAEVELAFPCATTVVRDVAIVSVIGSNLNAPGLLATAIDALSDADIPLLATFQSMRAIDIKFVVNDDDYERAIVHLHARLVEQTSKRIRRVA